MSASTTAWPASSSRRADSGIRSLVSVQGSLAMFAIWRWGSEEQKQEWLPRMAAGDGDRLLRPDRARPRLRPGSMRTRARRDGDDWVLDGRKMWITNGSIADVAVVWAQTDERWIRGFVVPTDTPGFSAPQIKHKMSLRASVTSELVLDGVRLPGRRRLPEVRGLKGPLSCLNEARYGIVWGALGAAASSLECACATRGAHPVRPADRRVPAHPAEARRHGGRDLRRASCSPCTSAGSRTPAGCVPSRSASASSTTCARRSRSAGPRGPSWAPTASRWSTP